MALPFVLQRPKALRRWTRGVDSSRFPGDMELQGQPCCLSSVLPIPGDCFWTGWWKLQIQQRWARTEASENQEQKGPLSGLNPESRLSWTRWLPDFSSHEMAQLSPTQTQHPPMGVSRNLPWFSCGCFFNYIKCHLVHSVTGRERWVNSQ